MLVQRLGLGDRLQAEPVHGVPLGAQRLERENHIIRGQRRTVGKLGLGPQVECDREAVFGNLDAVSDEPVGGIWLVR